MARGDVCAWAGDPYGEGSGTHQQPVMVAILVPVLGHWGGEASAASRHFEGPKEVPGFCDLTRHVYGSFAVEVFHSFFLNFCVFDGTQDDVLKKSIFFFLTVYQMLNP